MWIWMTSKRQRNYKHCCYYYISRQTQQCKRFLHLVKKKKKRERDDGNIMITDQEDIVEVWVLSIKNFFSYIGLLRSKTGQNVAASPVLQWAQKASPEW